jgi:PAS domain-containing protein
MDSFKIYANVINALPSSAVIIDSYGEILSANELFRNRFGDSETNIFKLHRLFSDTFFAEMVKKTFSDKQASKYQKQITGSNSKLQDCEISIGIIESENPAVLITIDDISDHAQRRREFNLLFEHTQSLIVIVDSDYNIIRSNKRFRMVFGDNFRKSLPDLYKKRKSEIPNMPVARCFKEGAPQMEAQTSTTHNGSKINLLSTALPFTSDAEKVTSVIEISNDITEINVMQDQLNSLNDNFMSILNLCDAGIMVITPKDKISIMNKTAKDMLGFKGNRKPGAQVVKAKLPAHIFEADRIDFENIELEREHDESLHLAVSSKKLSDNEGYAVILHKEESGLREVGLVRSDRKLDKVDLNRIVEDIILKMIQKSKEQYYIFINNIETSSPEQALATYKETHNDGIAYVAILERFFNILRTISKKRTNIKTETLIQRLASEMENIEKIFDIDIILVPEYTPTISINSSIFLETFVLLLFASASDIYKNSGIKGTIKIRFTCDDNGLPYIHFEDNYMDAREAISEDEMMFQGLKTAKPFLEYIKCKTEVKTMPYLGRKIIIRLP